MAPFNRKAAAAMVRAIEGAHPVGEQPTDAPPAQGSAASQPYPEQGLEPTPSLEAERPQSKSPEHGNSQTHSVTAPQAARSARTGSQASATPGEPKAPSTDSHARHSQTQSLEHRSSQA